MVYEDGVETSLLQLYARPQNSDWFSIISVVIFEVSVADEQKNYN